MFAEIDTGYRADRYEFSYDDGQIMAIHLPGHDLRDADALSAGAAIWSEWGISGWDEYGREDGLPRFGFEPPKRTWLIETEIAEGDEDYDEDEWGYTLHHYSDNPAGGRPVTVIQKRDTWRHRCAICGVRGQFGFPRNGGVLQVDDAELMHPVSDPRHVWLCSAHRRIVSDFETEVRAAVMTACLDCGHRMGGHERTETGTCWGPDPYGTKEPCDCTAVSPHFQVLTLDDLD